MKSSYFSHDIQEFLFLLSNYEVKYLIVGGEAVIYYGHPRLTGDIDIFYKLSSNNAKRLFEALKEFWDGEIPGIQSRMELLEPGVIIQFGVPPNRIDLINRIENVQFDIAWQEKVTETFTLHDKSISIYYIGIKQLIQNKASLKRPKDLEDLKYLEKVR